MLVGHSELGRCIILIIPAHPLFILHLLKDSRHELLELLTVGDSLPILCINDGHQFVEHEHDEVIVVGAASVFEDDLRVGEVAVGKGLYVIHLPDLSLQLLINFSGVCEGVFCSQVCKHSLLNVIVNQLHFGSTQRVLWTEDGNIFEDVFRTIDFGLFERHFVFEKVVEGG